MPLMFHYPGWEATRGHESISPPRAPYPVTLVPCPASQKMKVHPAMFMKTKERENFSRPTPGNIPGAPTSERRGSRRDPDPHFRLLDSFLDGISREVYENKGTGKCH